MNFLIGYAALLDYRYWINPRPVPLGPSLVGSVVAFFGWFLVAAVALCVAARYFRKRDKLKEDVLWKFSRLMFTTALLGYLALFLAYEQIPFLGMRAWFLAVFVAFAYMLVRAIVHAVRDYPELKRREAERRRFEQYLPKAK